MCNLFVNVYRSLIVLFDVRENKRIFKRNSTKIQSNVFILFLFYFTKSLITKYVVIKQNQQTECKSSSFDHLSTVLVIVDNSK